MTDTYTKKQIIGASLCDSSGRLGIHNAADLFMDIAGEHADLLGCGQPYLVRTGGFWLTVRSMFRFHKRPSMLEETDISTWPEVPGTRRCYRDYLLTKDGETLVTGKTEWAIMDIASGRLRHIEGIYPEDMELSGKLSMTDEFVRFGEELDSGEIIGTYTLKSTDIDIGGHMNNTAYLRAFESLFPSKEWNSMDIRFLEVWYRSQCFEGETLTARRIVYPDRTEAGFFHEDGSCALQLRYVTAQQET